MALCQEVPGPGGLTVLCCHDRVAQRGPADPAEPHLVALASLDDQGLDPSFPHGTLYPNGFHAVLCVAAALGIPPSDTFAASLCAWV